MNGNGAIEKCHGYTGWGILRRAAVVNVPYQAWEDHCGENPENLGKAGQDRARDYLGMREGDGRVSFEEFSTYLGSNSLATRLALLHSSPSMKASIASRMRSKLR